MSIEKLRVMAVMLVAVTSVSMGEAMLSRGMKQTNLAHGGWAATVRCALMNRHVLIGTLLMCVYFALYMLALKWADFSYVLPLSGLSFVLGAILARVYLGEQVTAVRWLGALIIACGVVIVGLGSPASSPQP